MNAGLINDLLSYLRELYSSNEGCTNTSSDGEPCIQCRERAKVINELETILTAQLGEATIKDWKEVSGIK